MRFRAPEPDSLVLGLLLTTLGTGLIGVLLTMPILGVALLLVIGVGYVVAGFLEGSIHG